VFRSRRLRIALGVLAAVIVVSLLAGASCFGRVVGGAEEGEEWDVRKGACTVAVAYRDDVPDDQKTVTRLYTVPFIAAGYDDARYFVAEWHGDQRGRVLGALERARDEGCRVDLFWLINGGDYVSWIETMPVDRRPAFGLVYDTGAGGSLHAERWRALGVHAFVGHPSVNIAPAFYTLFLPQWTLAGSSLDDGVRRANDRTWDVLRATKSLGLADDDDVKELWSGTEAILVGNNALTLE
jgi:hypothetical protein